MNSTLNTIVNMALGYYEIALAQEKQMCKEFNRRAELAMREYDDARKYPRKTKKKMRKEAEKNYSFYKMLAKPTLFSWEDVI